jgi:PqqD family protein of HPr-rel-A system
MPRPDSPPCWRLADPTAFATFDLDDDLVVYDRRSGQTHVFNALAAEAFRALQDRPLTDGQLYALLADVVEPERADEAAAVLAAVIERFAALGMIDPADA